MVNLPDPARRRWLAVTTIAARRHQMACTSVGRILLWGVACAFSFNTPAHAAGDVERGARASRPCMACHSFVPGRHMTGPSLAGSWGRKAGTAEGFGRYSEALKRSETVWDERNLDAWLRNPSALIPGTTMVFDGIADPHMRADLLAYLRAVSEGGASAPDQGPPSLKRVDVARQVSAIRYCGDAYRVVTGDQKTHTFWEFNLRFKTDGSPSGPLAGNPVIVGTGMQGDRAAVVFSRPEEISAFIRRECP
jgi:cytochrome c